MFRFAPATLFLMALTPACAAPDRAANAENLEAPTPAATTENLVTNRALPVNQRFPSLDAYLLYLKEVEGPSDGVWYKEVGKGLYEIQTGNARQLRSVGDPPAEPEKRTFTREELMEKFGFSK